jgi:adenylate kinase
VAGLARERKAICGRQDGELVVDVEKLADSIEDLRATGSHAIVEGHLSHHLRPNLCVVLRCSPRELRRRLAMRGYSEEKLLDNVESEAIDLILQEAMDGCRRTYEINATRKGPASVAKDISRIVSGKVAGFEPGKVDWSSEVLSWY